MTREPILVPAHRARTPPFRVEVSGTWHDPRLGTQEPWTQVFLVSAPGPRAAELAGTQLFGGEAARRRCMAMPNCSARVLVDGDVD